MGEKKTKREIKFRCKGVSFSPAFVGGNILDFQQMFLFVNRFLEIVSCRDLHNTRGERRAFHALLRTESIPVESLLLSRALMFMSFSPECVLHIPSLRKLPLSLSLIIHW